MLVVLIITMLCLLGILLFNRNRKISYYPQNAPKRKCLLVYYLKFIFSLSNFFVLFTIYDHQSILDVVNFQNSMEAKHDLYGNKFAHSTCDKEYDYAYM